MPYICALLLEQPLKALSLMAPNPHLREGVNTGRGLSPSALPLSTSSECAFALASLFLSQNGNSWRR